MERKLDAAEARETSSRVDGGVGFAELQQRDDVFREIVPSIHAAISDQRPAISVPASAAAR